MVRAYASVRHFTRWIHQNVIAMRDQNARATEKFPSALVASDYLKAADGKYTRAPFSGLRSPRFQNAP